MKAGLPRTLSLLCLACLASAVRAEDQAAPIPAAAAIDGAAKQRRWFSFLRKPRIQRTTRQSPPVVSGGIVASLFGGGLALWGLLRMVRFRMQVRSGSGGKMQVQERAASLGVLFGFPAGMCIYDKVYPCSDAPNEQGVTLG